MAGYRRQHGKPKLSTVRIHRRRQALDARLANASTPSERVGIAADHLRAALKSVSPSLAEQHAAEAVRQLVGRASKLYAALEGRAA